MRNILLGNIPLQDLKSRTSALEGTTGISSNAAFSQKRSGGYRRATQRAKTRALTPVPPPGLGVVISTLSYCQLNQSSKRFNEIKTSFYQALT